MSTKTPTYADWLMLSDSYVAFDIGADGKIEWYAARRNDRSFRGKTKRAAVAKAIKYARRQNELRASTPPQ